MVQIRKIHHVAYRCIDAKETVEWYGKYLNMDFVLAIAENQVPSTGEPDPYMHVFLDAGGGNILAFFELPTKEPMGRDPNTPAWVQHLAMQVDSDARGPLELPTRTPLSADRELPGPVGIELLHSVVAPIRHIHVTRVIDCDAPGEIELARAAAMRTPVHEKRAIPGELLHAMV